MQKLTNVTNIIQCQVALTIYVTPEIKVIESTGFYYSVIRD